MDNVLDYIYRRRSIRSFTNQAVTKDLTEKLLRAAMAAPSSCDRKTWEFVAITDKAILGTIGKYLKNSEYNPRLAILVCGNMNIANCTKCKWMKGECRELWIQDCSASMENMLIAASGLGLGSVWVGVYPTNRTIKFLSDTLKLPEEIVPLAIAYIGYPNEYKEPRTQYEEKKVHWQVYTV
jgi:nitroreductase